MKQLNVANYWPLLESYFREKSFAKQEIDSFNYFLDYKLPQIVEENKTVTPKIEEVKLELSGIEVLRPRIIEADGSPRTHFYPMEARIRNRTYSSPVFLTMKLLRRDVEQDVKKTYIGEVPIMVKSNRCWLYGKNEEELVEMGEDPKDFGGYFIVNGSEKALMTQEVLASDRVIISEKTQERVSAEVISTRGAFKGRVRITRTPDGMLGVTFPASPKKLRLFVLLKALGLKSKKEISSAFPEEQEIQNDVLLNLENTPVKDQNEALDRIGKFVAPGQVLDYRLRRAKEVIDAFLLPHIGQREEDRLAKAYYLATMATKAMEHAYDLRPEDDKDHYANKRLELSGKLMEHLFRYAFKYFIKDLTFQIDRTITRRRKLNINTVVRPGAISERIRFAMSTGNWIGRATGVSKFMDRTNFLSPLTDLRKVKSPLDKNRELYEARDVHGTHWGRLCPVETPDGPQCVTPDTQILLGDYDSMSIGDFEAHWNRQGIASVDWESDTKEEKKADIARYLKRTPTKTVIELKTKETGRTIRATLDHPFYSEKTGKTALSELQAGDRVAVLPLQPLAFEAPRGKTILEKKDILAACPEKTDAVFTVNALEKMGLLPFTDAHPQVLTVARLLGHLFGDGSLACSVKKFKSACTLVFSGKAGDLEEIRKDLRVLGVHISNTTVYHRKSVLKNGQVIEGDSTSMRCYSKPLWIFFRALGVPTGDKAAVAYGVPAWLKQQRKIVQKEFLAAYFGSEMTKPVVDKRNGKVFLQPAFSLNKTLLLVPSGVSFAAELEEMLRGFAVNVSQTKIVDGVVRKSGWKTKKIKVLFDCNLENLAALYGTIGFQYCAERKSLARLAFSYIQTKQYEIQKRKEALQTAVALCKNGASRKGILQTLNFEVREHDIANWAKKAKKGKIVSPRVPEIDFPSFGQWIREHALNENGLTWETIETIQSVPCSDVRDVTTVQAYHNFFANGFLTGNCGLVKNLALLAEVTTEVEEEPIEKALYRMGVKLKK